MVASRYGGSNMQIEYKLCSGSRYGAYKKVWQPEAGGFLEALPGWFGWCALGAVSSWQYLPRWLQAALGAAWLLTSLTALFLSESKLALAPAAVMAGKYKYTNTQIQIYKYTNTNTQIHKYTNKDAHPSLTNSPLFQPVTTQAVLLANKHTYILKVHKHSNMPSFVFPQCTCVLTSLPL